MTDHDIITIGGGIAGAALAKAMAERGRRVLVLERETQFKDRVRGEFIFPWGVAEARELGLLETLLEAGAHQPTYWTDYAGPQPLPPRNFAEDTPLGLHGLCLYHPRMQDALLGAARAAGAEVRRGACVRRVQRGGAPTLEVDEGGTSRTLSARLVVGADGRSSLARSGGGFEPHTEPPGNVIAGLLLSNVPASDQSVLCMLNPALSRMVFYLPQTQSSGRCYLVSRAGGGLRLRGNADAERFVDECVQSGLPAELLAGAKPSGPLASFECADRWVAHPHRQGVALVGDAAAVSDATWGQGLSLALRDARILRDALLANDDWAAAGDAYATAHDDHYGKIRTVSSWLGRLFFEPGPEADALRERVLPQLETDPCFLPDTCVAGPDLAPPTEAHREKLFGASGRPA